MLLRNPIFCLPNHFLSNWCCRHLWSTLQKEMPPQGKRYQVYSGDLVISWNAIVPQKMGDDTDSDHFFTCLSRSDSIIGYHYLLNTQCYLYSILAKPLPCVYVRYGFLLLFTYSLMPLLNWLCL